MVLRRGAYRVWLGKPEGRRPLVRSSLRWEDNIKMDLREVGLGHGLDRSGSGYGKVTCCCECGNETSGCMKCEKLPDYLRTA
jgi:hypothetical protein